MSKRPKLETIGQPSTSVASDPMELEVIEIDAEDFEDEIQVLEPIEKLDIPPSTNDADLRLEQNGLQVFVDHPGDKIQLLDEVENLDNQPSTSDAERPLFLDGSQVSQDPAADKIKPLEGAENTADQPDVTQETSVPQSLVIQETPNRKPIYSDSHGTYFSSRNLCLINEETISEVGPYKWQVKWYIDSKAPDGPSTSSESSKMLVVEVLKLSDYIFDWKLRLLLEFRDYKQRPIRKLFDVYDKYEMQTYIIKYDDDEDLAKICLRSTVTLQWISISVNNIWENCATEVNLEDPNRAHDFVIVATGKCSDVIAVEDIKTFYVHLSYLRAWSCLFQKMIAPASPYIVNDDPEIMSVLLSLFHPNMADVLNDDNIIKVLYMAKKYEVWNVVRRITSSLCDTKSYPKISMLYRLHMGYSFKHRWLMIRSLKQIQVSCKKEKRRMLENEPKLLDYLSDCEMAELLIALTNNTLRFEENILKSLSDMKFNDVVPTSECDKVLVLGDSEIPVNSYVLATWSPFFDDLYFNNPETSRLPLDYVVPAIFTNVLWLIQTKNIQILAPVTVHAVLEVAYMLKMPSIIAMCSSYISKNGYDGPTESLDFFNLAVRVNSGNLIDAALHKIANIRDKLSFVKNNLQYISTLTDTARTNVDLAIATEPKRGFQPLPVLLPVNDPRAQLLAYPSNYQGFDRDLPRLLGPFD